MNFEISLAVNSKAFFAKFGSLEIGNVMLPYSKNKYGFIWYSHSVRDNVLGLYWGLKEKWFGLDRNTEQDETLYVVDSPDQKVTHSFYHEGKLYIYHSGLAIVKNNGVEVKKPTPYWILDTSLSSDTLFDNFPMGLVTSPSEYPEYLKKLKKQIEEFKKSVPN